MPESWSNITSQCASKLFLEEIRILISRLSKEDWAHHCGLASSNLLRAWIEWRDGGRANMLFTWTGTSIFTCPETLALLVLGLSDSDWDWEPQIFRPFVLWITLLAFPVLHFRDSRLWDLFASIICEWFPIIHLSIYFLISHKFGFGKTLSNIIHGKWFQFQQNSSFNKLTQHKTTLISCHLMQSVWDLTGALLASAPPLHVPPN